MTCAASSSVCSVREVLDHGERQMSDLAGQRKLSGAYQFAYQRRCIYVAADAGVADALADQPASAADLAKRCDLNADALIECSICCPLTECSLETVTVTFIHRVPTATQ